MSKTSPRMAPRSPADRWDTALEAELLKDFAPKNFWFFFCDVFGAGMNPKGQRWIDEKVHRPMCDWFQKHVEDWSESRRDAIGKQKHLAILIPRELGKTTIVSQAGQLWLHLRDPELSSYVGSESVVLAAKILDGIKATLEGSDPFSLFTKLFGDWSGEARAWSAKQVTHSARKNTSRKDPSFGTFSVETSITGSHPDVIVIDDPISYERLMTDQNWLATVNSQITSLFPVLQSDGLLIFVGTRYDDNDHFGTSFRDEGVKTHSGMATDSFAPVDDGVWDVYFLAARDKDGNPITKVWNEERLKRYEKRDPLRYAAQVMNDPNLSESNPVTRDQLMQCVVKPDEVPWGMLRYAALCDTAFWDGKSKARKDETVMLVVGYPRDHSGDVYYIEGYGSNTWRGEDLGNRLVSTVQRYRKQGRRFFAITDEVTMAGKKGTWEANLRNYFHDVSEPMPNFIEFKRPAQRKTKRIVSALQFVVNGHFKFVDGAPGIHRLIDQMCKVGQMMVNPRLNDDWVDAFADAFQPELYQPMRRPHFTGRQKPPWERGSQLLDVDGLDTEMFTDDEWAKECPREPIK